MMGGIIDETLRLLKERRNLEGLRIIDLYLSNYFNCVKLSDGSVGACMTYAQPTDEDGNNLRELFLSKVREDPLLLHSTSDPLSRMEMNLRCCIVNALSSPLLSKEYRSDQTEVSELVRGFSRAVVVGFGGYLQLVLKLGTPRVHVCDLQCDTLETIRKRHGRLCRQFPQTHLTLSDGSDLKERLEGADLVCITGSALCNGTMEDVLTQTQPGQRVIVQGESASIIPDVLFSYGVDVLTTSLKPSNLLDTARQNRQEFRRLLESGLPLIHLRNDGDTR